MHANLSLAAGFSGVDAAGKWRNRFNGFPVCPCKAAEVAGKSDTAAHTRLKPGANERSRFFLSYDGFIPGFTQYGEKFIRPARGTPPVIELPPLIPR